jgi:sialic acid synthase SpsE
VSHGTIFIGDVAVGDGQPCFIIAEIGSNHDNNLDQARKLIDEAAKAGVDAVKFQTFRAAEHYSRYTPGFEYLDSQNTFELIKSLEMDRSWHAVLKEHAEAQGVAFFTSPCDPDAVAELAALEAPAYKVASFDLPDVELIGQMARTGKPVILSTGMANREDIQRGVQACRSNGNEQVVLLQCTSLYPAPADLSNLRAMATMRADFDCLAGYSDHTEGDSVAVASVAMGACMIEKHFTLDSSLPGPDHTFAIEPQALAALVRKVRDVEAALGDGLKDGPRAAEREMFEKGRRSLHTKVDIAAGQVIETSMLTVKRPGLGISPAQQAEVVGRVAKMDIAADHWITWNMI